MVSIFCITHLCVVAKPTLSPDLRFSLGSHSVPRGYDSTRRGPGRAVGPSAESAHSSRPPEELRVDYVVEVIFC